VRDAAGRGGRDRLGGSAAGGRGGRAARDEPRRQQRPPAVVIAGEHPQQQLGGSKALLAQRLVDRREALGLGRGVVEADDRDVARGSEPALPGGEAGAEGERVGEREDGRGVRRPVEEGVGARAAALGVADLALLHRHARPVEARRLGGAARALQPAARDARGRAGLLARPRRTGVRVCGQPEAEHAEPAVAEVHQMADGGGRGRALVDPDEGAALRERQVAGGRRVHDDRG